MPSLTKNSNRSKEVEKRKLHAASKKKDPDKITEQELEKLLDLVDDKFCKLRSVFNHLLYTLFDGLKKSESSEIEICSVKVNYYLNLVFKRNKSNIKIEELSLDISRQGNHYFNRNLDSLILISHKTYGGLPTLDPLKQMIVFQKVISNLNEKYNIINKKIVNQFIKDIDGLLGLYCVNPAVNSSSNSYDVKFEKFKNNYINYYKPKIFRIIKEDINYSNVNNVSKLYGTLYFEYSFPRKYKITFNFSRRAAEYELSLNVFGHNQNGWILLFAEGKPNNVFKDSNEKMLITEESNKLVVADKIITYAIKFIQTFEDLPVGVKL